MTDMIERVAKAIHGSCNTWTAIPQTWDRLNSTERRALYFAARAAITAMREPTEEMAQTVASAYTAGVANPKMITKIYSAVVDAALEGK
jgi:hypothetical protein